MSQRAGRYWPHDRTGRDFRFRIKKKSSTGNALAGKNFLVTAGPTYEPIDPVRFIGNYSSGKMGFAIAEELAMHGALVHLVSGPTNLKTNKQNISTHYVQTAEQMYQACMDVFEKCNGAVLSAAVADYRVAEISEKKLKKDAQNGDTFTLTLVKNKDILASLGKLKKPGQILGGFSLETHNETAYAKEKLIRKNCNFIVLNSLNDKGAGFA
ncbi:MAG: phosphopantothenoylcysteine decarboxylase domain-containing protein, partial [Bacteroidia bacterium]